MDKNNSLISVDMVRALAATGVFFYHQHVGLLLAKFTGISSLDITDNFGAEYAVPLFFLISGFCIHLSNIKYLNTGASLPLKQYYKKRLLRIYPPYLFALLFALGVNYLVSRNFPDTTDIVTHLFALQGLSAQYFNSINVVLWTITIELGFYLIYPLFYFVRNRFSLNIALLSAFIVSALSIWFLSGQPILFVTQRFFVLNLWFAWCCGAYLADIYMLKPNDMFKPAHIAAYFIIVAGFLSIHFIPNNYPILLDQFNILIWTLPLLLALKSEPWLTKNAGIMIRVIVKIGLSSYSLYLLHLPLIVLKNYLAHQFLPPSLQLPAMIIGIALIFVISWYSFVYIEKPFTIRKKNNAAAA